MLYKNLIFYTETFMRSDHLRFEIKEIKIDLLLTKNIYVKGNSRCCREHLNELGLIGDIDASNVTEIKHNVSLTGNQIVELIKIFRLRE